MRTYINCVNLVVFPKYVFNDNKKITNYFTVYAEVCFEVGDCKITTCSGSNILVCWIPNDGGNGICACTTIGGELSFIVNDPHSSITMKQTPTKRELKCVYIFISIKTYYICFIGSPVRKNMLFI